MEIDAEVKASLVNSKSSNQIKAPLVILTKLISPDMTSVKPDDSSRGESNEWSIYKLVNYSGSGSLIELCRSNLKNFDSQQDKDEVQNNGTFLAKRIKNEERSGQQALDWWILNEPVGDLAQEEFNPNSRWASQICQISSVLVQLVSPYLIRKSHPAGRPLMTNRSFSSFNRNDSNERANSSQDSEEQFVPDCKAQKDRLNKRRLVWPRRLAPIDRTHSLELTDSKTKAKQATCDTDRRPKTRFEYWLSRDRKLKSLFPNSPLNLEESRCQLDSQEVSWSRMSLKRGKYGESLVHILIVGQSNEHLILLTILLHFWPSLLFDAFQSKKFFGLNCLHLCIAYGSATSTSLLTYLLAIAERLGRSKWFCEQRVYGSLFRSPASKQNYSSESATKSWLSFGKYNYKYPIIVEEGSKQKISSAQWPEANLLYWCDQVDNWPTINGQAHLILSDRADSHSNFDDDSNERLPIYLGELPLSWSVALGARSSYEIMLANGADPNDQDADGNGCLHQLVINKQTNWTRFLVRSGARTNQCNNLGFTPFLLAAYLGQYELFEEILELSAVEFWSYSMIRCCGYPLISLDSIIATNLNGDEKIEKGHRTQSAVLTILESRVSSDEQKAQLLSSSVVEKLLEEKWRLYARRLFYSELFMTLFHLALFTLANTLRADKMELSDHDRRSDWSSSRVLIRTLSELGTVLISAIQVISFVKEWTRYGDVSLQWIYNPLVPNLLLANLFILTCFPLRLIKLIFRLQKINSTPIGDWTDSLDTWEDILLVLASPLLWSSLFFFIAAFRVTGPFVAMIRYMIVRDLRQFSLIYLIFLCSFAQSIFFVNHSKRPSQVVTEEIPSMINHVDTNKSSLSLWLDYVTLWMDLFKMTLGVYELEPFRHSILARIFLLLFIYLIPILFNMLIAMMNNTYSLVISQSERAWSFQWARTLIALERRVEQSRLDEYQRKYSINMAASSKKTDSNEQEYDNGTELGGSKFVPALMLIKRMNYTRAERRRLILGYWQRSIKSILDMNEEQRRHLTAQ